MLSVVMVVEGVLRAEDSEAHFETGIGLYHSLAKNTQLYLLTHVFEEGELNGWMHRRNLAGHLNLLHAQAPGPAGRLDALERVRSWRIGLVIEPDPECAAAELEAGWSTLLHTHAAYTRPAWRPDYPGTPRPWGVLTAAIEKQSHLRANDPRHNFEEN